MVRFLVLVKPESKEQNHENNNRTNLTRHVKYKEDQLYKPTYNQTFTQEQDSFPKLKSKASYVKVQYGGDAEEEAIIDKDTVDNLCKAARVGNVHKIKQLCMEMKARNRVLWEEGEKPINIPAVLSMEDDSWESPLCAAAGGNHTKVMEFLLREGAEINAVVRGSPLCAAAGTGNFDALRLLITKGANINQPDSFGWTPLTTAVECNQPKSVEILVAAGADRAYRFVGDTALDIAEKRRLPIIMEILKEKIKGDRATKNQDDAHSQLEKIEQVERHGAVVKKLLKRNEAYSSRKVHGKRDQTNVSGMSLNKPVSLSSNVWRIPIKSGLYQMKEENIMVSIPPGNQMKTRDMYVMIRESKSVQHLTDVTGVLSDIITLHPHGIVFQNHILLKFPLKSNKPVDVKDVQLMYSDSEYGDNMRWINVKQNNTRFRHADGLFWFISQTGECFLFLRHFCHIFLAQHSSKKQQEALHLDVSLHGLFTEHAAANLFQMEMAMGFHCGQCYPNLLQKQNKSGIQLGSMVVCLYSDEGPVKTNVTINNSTEQWKCRNSNLVLDSNTLMSLCNYKGIYSMKSLYYTEELTTAIRSEILHGEASVSQKEVPIGTIPVITKVDILAKCKSHDASCNTDFSELDSKNQALPSAVIQSQTSSNSENEVGLGRIQTSRGVRSVPTNNQDSSDEEFYDVGNELNPPEEVDTRHTGAQNVNNIQYNLTVQNQFNIVSDLPQGLSHLLLLPHQPKEGECVFNSSVLHEQKKLCDLLDNDYKDLLQNIAKEIGDTNGTVDLKNITGLSLLQVWQIHVKSSKHTWKEFYQILRKLNCDRAAHQLKVVYEKDRLISQLEDLKWYLKIQDICGVLVSRGIIDMEKRDQIRKLDEKKAVEYLVLDILVRSTYDCVRDFQNILINISRYFRQFVQQNLMLCPEELSASPQAI